MAPPALHYSWFLRAVQEIACIDAGTWFPSWALTMTAGSDLYLLFARPVCLILDGMDRHFDCEVKQVDASF